jgi:hypothetical protein
MSAAQLQDQHHGEAETSDHEESLQGKTKECFGQWLPCVFIKEMSHKIINGSGWYSMSFSV